MQEGWGIFLLSDPYLTGTGFSNKKNNETMLIPLKLSCWKMVGAFSFSFSFSFPFGYHVGCLLEQETGTTSLFFV